MRYVVTLLLTGLFVLPVALAGCSSKEVTIEGANTEERLKQMSEEELKQQMELQERTGDVGYMAEDMFGPPPGQGQQDEEGQ